MEKLVKNQNFRMCQVHICRFKLYVVFMLYTESGSTIHYTICMVKRNMKGCGHIREKQQFLSLFFKLSYLFDTIPLNLNKFENNTPREETLKSGIVYLYLWQIEPEIRAFRLKFNSQVQSTPPPKFY